MGRSESVVPRFDDDKRKSNEAAIATPMQSDIPLQGKPQMRHPGEGLEAFQLAPAS
jgi:hypothetical protein